MYIFTESNFPFPFKFITHVLMILKEKDYLKLIDLTKFFNQFSMIRTY